MIEAGSISEQKKDQRRKLAQKHSDMDKVRLKVRQHSTQRPEGPRVSRLKECLESGNRSKTLVVRRTAAPATAGITREVPDIVSAPSQPIPQNQHLYFGPVKLSAEIVDE
jgi:hypothetical protein